MKFPMQVLIVGGTGTLGRQIAKNAIDAGHQVRCMVRSPRKAAFLQEWGCELVQGDLLVKESFEYSLENIDAVIDASTCRADSTRSVYEIDWEGKLKFFQECDRLNIKRIVFLSLFASENHRNVPLMDVKFCTEKLLEESSFDYTILKSVAFMQGVINQYAIPVLENQAVWLSSNPAEIAYMNTQDIARFAVASLVRPETIRKSFPIVGSKAWKAEEIISLCEKICSKDEPTKTLRVSKFLMGFGQSILEFFESTLNISDRLSFSDVTGGGASLVAPMEDVYKAFGLDPKDTTQLEQYLREYYSIIMKRMRELDIDVSKEEKRRVPF